LLSFVVYFYVFMFLQSPIVLEVHYLQPHPLEQSTSLETLGSPSLGSPLPKHGNTCSNHDASLDSIMVPLHIPGFLELCTRKRNAPPGRVYPINTQSTVLGPISICFDGVTTTLARHPHTCKYLYDGLFPVNYHHGIDHFFQSAVFAFRYAI